MFSIKDSFADCSTCPLHTEPSCILETNSKDDLTKVEIVFVAENPGKNEVEDMIPLVGKSGKLFRKYFDKHIKNNFKWLITNCVLCLTLDEKGNTGNPTDEVIERCKVNCFEIIKVCNPKLIVTLGTSPMKAFGLGTSGITNMRGKQFKWNDYDVLLTVHPSYVLRNNSYEGKFEEDIISASQIVNFLDKPDSERKQFSSEIYKKERTEKGIFRYKIPEKFYTDEYRLVDIQYSSKLNEILYIFRDKDNKKVYHKEKDDYIYYEAPKEIKARKIVPYDELYQVKIPYKDRYSVDLEISYEADIKVNVKHAMDYYHFNKGEAKRINYNIFYMDIEIDTGHTQIFPNPKEAKYPINMITGIYHKNVTCYVLNNNTAKINNIPDVQIKVFNDEKKLLTTFITDFVTTECDYVSGWNSISFDLEYIYNRLPKLKLQQNSMSKFKEFYVDGSRYVCNILGCIALDQLFLYKSFTFTKKENYKLGTIGEIEVGQSKVELNMPINEVYYKDINKLIEYNIRDSQLLEKIEEKTGHIKLLNEIREICNSTFDGANSSFGQVDSIIVSFLRSKGLASKNSDPNINKTEYPGAFVLEPIPGIYSSVADLDYSSLYPSLIMTYNIGINNFVMRTKDLTLGYDLSYNRDNLPDEINMIIDPTFEKEKKLIKKEDLFNIIENEKLIHTINGCFFKNHLDEVSVYSQVLENLLSGRKTYKKKMLDAKESGDSSMKDFYNTKQLVYKLLANALYGIIANKAFRFFDINCASAITLGGQETLKTSIIEGDNYIKFMNSELKDPLEGIKPLTKMEMYSKEMPDRKPKFVIVSDTDSIFVCFEKFKESKTDEKIITWCKEIQSYLNKTSILKTISYHNVNPEKNKLELKNELVIKRGIFLAKKAYAIYVTNQEGRSIDETVYMGISVKRSDTPSQTKIFLKELLDMILKSENFSLPLLFKFIERKEKEFIKLIKEGSKTIAKPVGWNKELKDYTSLTEGIRGMINFNEISYPIHTVGTKGYLFHINGIDLEKAPKDVKDNYNKNILEKGKKLDVITIPDEEKILPNYFIPNIKMNLLKSFKERYELILKPVTEVKKRQEILTI